MKITQPILYFDLETTGTDVKNDRIVEISCIKHYPDTDEQDERTMRINPVIPIPKSASDVHGITDFDVRESPTFKQIAKALHKFFTDESPVIAGYNSNTFDVPLLYAEFNRAGIVWDLSGVTFIDVCAIFKRKEERTLSAAVKFYTGQEHTGAHSALADVKATITVFTAQLEKYDLSANVKELDLYCNYDKPRFDIGGCFTKDEAGEWILNFGKHKGKQAAQNKDYLVWMLGQDFLPDAKSIINQILK